MDKVRDLQKEGEIDKLIPMVTILGGSCGVLKGYGWLDVLFERK